MHNLNRVTDSSRERLNLQSALKTAYRSEHVDNMLVADKHLFDKPLHHLQRLPNALIRAWLDEIKVAQKTRDEQFSTDNASSSVIMRAFLQQKNTAPSQQILINPNSLPSPLFSPINTTSHQSQKKQ